MLQAVEESLLLCCAFNIFLFFFTTNRRDLHSGRILRKPSVLSCCKIVLFFIAGLPLLYTYNEILARKEVCRFFLKIQLIFIRQLMIIIYKTYFYLEKCVLNYVLLFITLLASKQNKNIVHFLL